MLLSGDLQKRKSEVLFGKCWGGLSTTLTVCVLLRRRVISEIEQIIYQQTTSQEHVMMHRHLDAQKALLRRQASNQNGDSGLKSPALNAIQRSAFIAGAALQHHHHAFENGAPGLLSTVVIKALSQALSAQLACAAALQIQRRGEASADILSFRPVSSQYPYPSDIADR